MTPTAAPTRDGVVSVTVDIVPLPGINPSPSVSEAPSPSGLPDHGWLAATGVEPAWLIAGGAVLLVALGAVLVRSRRRRS
jgi:LPXTG-motif cell wall-anchored protein